MNMDHTLEELKEAEILAEKLFELIEEKELIRPGISEQTLNDEIYRLAFNELGIRKYWHKRIVRAGKNTLLPYAENPENLVIQNDDILFVDFGPIFENWEADFGKTYVIGSDAKKLKLKSDLENAWDECQAYYLNKTNITGLELYTFACSLAKKYDWEFGGEIAGHIIGHFPHEQLEEEDKRNYVHPENLSDMKKPLEGSAPRYWILEMHFIDRDQQIGGFMEKLLSA